MKPILIKDTIFHKHNTGESHPENVKRLISIYQEIETLEPLLDIVAPIKATKEQILKVHSEAYYYNLQDASANERPLDPDTVTSKDSFEVAHYAAGAGIVALDRIKAKHNHLAFCAIRPPGHHATDTRGMGFCLFNNIAISAKYAQEIGYKKVFIIDFDVHHGNGTQDIFYTDNSVFYFSTHQAFAYPGTGTPDETGLGKGEGYTFNYPLMPNSTDKELLEVYDDELAKLIDNFNPDIILISAGYDLHESDPLATLDITFDGVKNMVKKILNQKAKVPKIFFLEGGYNLKALAKNVQNTLLEMINQSK